MMYLKWLIMVFRFHTDDPFFCILLLSSFFIIFFFFLIDFVHVNSTERLISLEILDLIDNDKNLITIFKGSFYPVKHVVS